MYAVTIAQPSYNFLNQFSDNFKPKATTNNNNTK